MRLTRNLVLAGIAVGVGILRWVLPPTAWAQTPRPEQAEQDQWSFRPGAIELGVQIGGGFSLADTTREATEFALLPRMLRQRLPHRDLGAPQRSDPAPALPIPGNV